MRVCNLLSAWGLVPFSIRKLLGAHEILIARHDWGSQVCYEAARMRPDIFTAVVAIAIPVTLLHPAIGRQKLE